MTPRERAVERLAKARTAAVQGPDFYWDPDSAILDADPSIEAALAHECREDVAYQTGVKDGALDAVGPGDLGAAWRECEDLLLKGWNLSLLLLGSGRYQGFVSDPLDPQMVFGPSTEAAAEALRTLAQRLRERSEG